MHQNSPQVETLCKEQNIIVNLEISVEDVMCVVNLNTEWLTALNKMTKLM